MDTSGGSSGSSGSGSKVEQVVVWVLASTASAVLAAGIVVASLPEADQFRGGLPSLADRILLMTQQTSSAVWLVLGAGVVARLAGRITLRVRQWLVAVGAAVAVLSLAGTGVFVQEMASDRNASFFLRVGYPWMIIMQYLAHAAVGAVVAWWVAKMPEAQLAVVDEDEIDTDVVDLEDM